MQWPQIGREWTVFFIIYEEFEYETGNLQGGFNIYSSAHNILWVFRKYRKSSLFSSLDKWRSIPPYGAQLLS